MNKVFKFLKIISIIIFSMILLFSGCAFYGYQKGQSYEATAVPYIEEVLPKISNWDLETNKMYSTPESNESMKDEDLSKLLKWLSKLGDLESFEKPQFTGIMNGNLIKYVFIAHYKNGDATITMQLKDDNGKFLIDRFHVDSMALIE